MRTRFRLIVIACFVILSSVTGNATAHVIYLDNDGSTVYIGSDSLRPMDHGDTCVCKSVSNGNTVIVLYGRTTNPHESGAVDHSFYKIADEILRRNESLDQKFEDLRQAGPAHIRALMALHPEWEKTAQPSSIVLQVAMIGFITERPKLWLYETHVDDWNRGPEPPTGDASGHSFNFFIVGHPIGDRSKFPRSYPGGSLKLVNDVLEELSSDPQYGVGKPFTVIKLTNSGAEQVQDEKKLCSTPRKGQ